MKSDEKVQEWFRSIASLDGHVEIGVNNIKLVNYGVDSELSLVPLNRQYIAEMIGLAVYDPLWCIETSWWGRRPVATWSLMREPHKDNGSGAARIADTP